jgi:hypothetical protein
MPDASPDFLSLFRTLSDRQVEFIVVGGVCAVLHGAPVTTFDLDVVHSRRAENVTRLLSVLDDLDAYYRGRGEQRLRPGRDHLASPGHQLLMTRFGPLDLLGAIGADHDYDELLPHTIEYEVGELRLCVLDLETLIRVKEEVGFEKDRAVLPILRRTLEEKKKER